MSKAVLISIKPKWCGLIASGKKTIEVRKTRPQLDAPFKCYIYCTQGKAKDPHELLEIHSSDGKIRRANGKVIGEFVCDLILSIDPPYGACADGTFLTAKEMYEYSRGKQLYGWHISDLVVYDRPKGLEEFKQCYKCEYHAFCRDSEISCDGA